MRILGAVFFFLVAIGALNAQERRFALVIGNSEYADDRINLDNPQNDAADLAAVLDRIGFDVTRLINLDIARFDTALLDFTTKARNADVALFFFAGHGLQISGRSFLMPTDAKLENEASALRELIAIQEVISKIENVAKTSVIIIDACRNNPLANELRRRVRVADRSTLVAEGLGRVSVIGSNTLVVYSTVPGELAKDGIGQRNSPFARSLLRHITTPGLEVEIMFKRVTADVLRSTQGQQQPERLSRLQTEVVFTPMQSHLHDNNVSHPQAEEAPLTGLTSSETTEDEVKSVFDVMYPRSLFPFPISPKSGTESPEKLGDLQEQPNEAGDLPDPSVLSPRMYSAEDGNVDESEPMSAFDALLLDKLQR